MPEPHALFEQEALKQAGSLNRIQKDTANEVVRLLKLARQDIQAKLKAQPTDYNLWYLPQLNKAIEQQLNEWQEDAAKAASNGQLDAFDAGQSAIAEPVSKLGLDLTVLAPKLDTGQLKAMQAFTTSKMKDVALDTVNRLNSELALTVIGSQLPSDTIRRVQEIMEGVTKSRAVAIVRTELGRAYGVAAQARMEQAVEHVPGMKKQWRRSGKIHSRRTHDLTDGQVRPIDQPFIIGTGHVTEGKDPPGPRLMHPHDPKGPVSEVVNCGCISLPFLDEWKDEGIIQTPGKKPFSEQEIALNPLKADLHYLDETPTMAQYQQAADKIRMKKEVSKAVKAIAKEQGPLELARSMAKMDAKLAAYKLEQAQAGTLGKWHQQAAKLLPSMPGKTLDEIATSLKADYSQKVNITAYKKAVLAGKNPTAKQLSAWNELDLESKGQFENELAAFKDKQEAATVLAKTANPVPATLDRLSIVDVKDWKQVGPQAGSNPGGLFEDTQGAKWYVKFPADAARAHNEVLAAKLYQLVGIEVPEVSLVSQNGTVGVASRIIDGLVKDGAALQAGKISGVAEGFATDAWLANWDVVGLGYDNLMVNGTRALRVDTGGAMLFRAQGAAKSAAFGDIVTELDTLRDAAVNPQAANVFGKLSKAEIKASVARVLATDDGLIRQTVMAHAEGDFAARNALADRLIARKEYLNKAFPDVFPKIAEARKAAVEATKTALHTQADELDNALIYAIKGIASRAAKGVALEEKDIARAANALSRYDALLAKGTLSTQALEALKAHYTPWLEALQNATAKGAGQPATWNMAGKFGGIPKAALDVNAAKVKPAFLAYLFGESAQFSEVEIKKILRELTDHLGAGDYVNTAKITAHSEDAKAFEKMPPGYKRVLWSWTPGSIYREVNKQLLREANEGIKASPFVKAYERMVNDALLRQAPPERVFKGRSTRGMSMSSQGAKEYYQKLKAIQKADGFYNLETISSSTVGDDPGFSGNVWLEIEGKSGVHINSISDNTGRENEVLFGTESKFKVDDIYIDGSTYHFKLKEV